MNLNLVGSLITLIPSILQFVEEIHGPKTGSAKLGAAVNLTQVAAVQMAQAGVIPEGDAHDVLGITNLVQDTFDKSTLALKKSPAPIKAPAATPLLPNLNLTNLINRGK